jgi:hypothetical protein
MESACHYLLACSSISGERVCPPPHLRELPSEFAPIRDRPLPRLGCLMADRHGHPRVVVVAGIRPTRLTGSGARRLGRRKSEGRRRRGEHLPPYGPHPAYLACQTRSPAATTAATTELASPPRARMAARVSDPCTAHFNPAWEAKSRGASSWRAVMRVPGVYDRSHERVLGRPP